MTGGLEGKVAIVSGGVRGIGRAIVLTFLQQGAKVTGFDLDADDSPPVIALKESLGNYKEGFLYKKADITDMQNIEEVAKKTIAAFGRIDILINNAGGGMDPVPLEDLAERDWDRMVRVNLKGNYICARAVIKHMKEQKSGKIINISSQAGRSKSELSNLPYASSKAGVLGFTRQLAWEVGPYGIQVNAIAPGLVLSGERVEKRWKERSQEERNEMLKNIPLGRLGKPEEIAWVAEFLATDKSSYITGATIDVNGGRFMM